MLSAYVKIKIKKKIAQPKMTAKSWMCICKRDQYKAYNR